MLKKLLTLCLALAMLSVAVMASPVTYTLAAELEDTAPETTEELTKAFDYTAFEELLFVQPSETEGAYGVTKFNMGAQSSRGSSDVANEWWLAKVNIGNNWNFDSENAAISMTANVRTYAGNFTSYGIPVTEVAYESAKAAADAKTTISTLIQPANAAESGITPGTEQWDKTENKDGNNPKPVSFVASQFSADHYKDGYLYVAFQVVNTSLEYTTQPRYYLSKTDSWTFSITGTRTLETATATVSAAYVDATTEGQQTISSVENINEGKEVSAYKWMVYKFEVPTHEIINNIQLNLTCSATGDKWANVCVYPLTDAEYYATAIGSGQTQPLNSENKQTLLENIIATKRDVQYPKPRISSEGKITSDTAVTMDLTSLLSNDIKDGAAYVAVFAFNNQTIKTGADSNNKRATLKNPTLTVKGVPGKSTATTVNDFSDTVLMWNGTDNNSYDVCTQTTSGKAVLIAATYSGTEMVDAKLVPIDAATKANGAISGNVSDLTVGEGETLKLYLWADGTLTPILTEPIVF